MNDYHKDKFPKRITLKVDIAKAFDFIRWDFILDCLRALQLPDIYIQWAAACLTTISFSIGINGNLHGYFKGSRAVRQRDPISLYLFCLAMNILSHMLNDAASQGKFKYHPMCEEPRLTHLCFADDFLIFFDDTTSTLRVSCQCSRALINYKGWPLVLRSLVSFPLIYLKWKVFVLPPPLVFLKGLF